MNFAESLNYLYGLGYELSVKKFGLENTFKLLKALDHPEKQYLKVQIAGTNGKGSTCAFLESICVRAGIRLGKYTSPHLISITERIRVDGREIAEKKFARYATRVRRVSEKLVETGELEALPTFFEQVTAIALTIFADEKVELAILETGLGGRFDATTATRAEIVALTPIDLDHQNILGNTLTKIASEKAAIIRSDTRVLIAPQKNEAERIIYGKCRESGVEPIRAEPEVSVIEDLGAGLLFVDFRTPKTNYKAEMHLRGKHQWINAGLAIYLAENLHDFGFDISKEDIETGLEIAKHKGRLESWGRYLFDGAHNISGAGALRRYLDESVERPIIMIFGAMKEKDLSEIAPILFTKAEKLILTKPDNPRSMEVAKLAGFVPPAFSKENLFLTENVSEALRIAEEISAPENLICVTGSLYLVGEAQKILQVGSEI